MMKLPIIDEDTLLRIMHKLPPSQYRQGLLCSMGARIFVINNEQGFYIERNEDVCLRFKLD